MTKCRGRSYLTLKNENHLFNISSAEFVYKSVRTIRDMLVRAGPRPIHFVIGDILILDLLTIVEV